MGKGEGLDRVRRQALLRCSAFIEVRSDSLCACEGVIRHFDITVFQLQQRVHCSPTGPAGAEDRTCPA